MTIQEEIVIAGKRYGCSCTITDNSQVQDADVIYIRRRLREDLSRYQKRAGEALVRAQVPS